MGEESMRAIALTDKGGHFYRADFQVHTPRDTQWDGARPALADRERWAITFVAAARERGLGAVAISDHHDFAFFPYIRKAAAEEVRADGSQVPEAERLVVFPALELTLSVPCQAILILDADFPEDRLDDVLKALHFDPVDPSLDALPQTTVLPDSGDINDLHAKLDKHDWLRGRYILLPNVTPSGHKTLLRTSFQAKYRDMTPTGGYLDGSIAELDKQKNAGEKRILEGGDVHWGSKRLALFQTSDARKADFSTLGQHSTWVKWSSPTAEALRQACLAQESRLSQVEPAFPNIWISRVIVSQSKFLGRVDVALNPQYTALIGGRGTGKSTILDYLRWALCDQPASSTADDEVADPRVRQRRLIDVTLKPLKAHVEVHCVINGITHVVRRHAEDGAVQLKVGEGDFEKVREGAIQSLLPIQAYSQKQLSSVAIRIDELLRFVTSPIQRDLEEIERKQHEVAGRLRENYGTLQRHRDLSTEIERSELRVRSLGEQAQALRDGLSGLSEADRVVLDGKAAHDRARTGQAAWTQHLSGAHSELTEMASDLEISLGDMTRPEAVPADIASEVEASFDASVAALADLKVKVLGLASEFAALLADGGAVALPSTALAAKLDEYDKTYAAVKTRSSAHEAKLAELAKLEEQQKLAGDLAQRQRKERDALGKPVERHQELRKELTECRSERSATLAAQCEGLSNSSDGMIRATLSVSRGFDAALAKFKALVTGSNVRTNKIESFFEELAKESDPAATWELVLQELESLMLLEPDADVKSEQTPTLSRLGFAVSDQKKVIPKVTPDGWLDLSLTELADFPEFEYRAKEDEYIPFDSASAGQQASALLATLLSQGGTPLIIDQPEDDLDSDTVQQIVAKIWASKSSRQLIFSSHNANLVVNGDADLVLVCAYVNAGDQSAGHIKEQGAIDVAAVRDQITAVMEGGEKAFRLRKEKYGF
ncbi:AAA family ATPase [Nocardioides sp. zg-ZUI104]|uniref:TrlF family AAA-like ATPase n=1 Tax=Nocardioides faecalis TaxID=2803858 RepID=UPI001BCB6EE3|nr:AAA family ATPase [Nocardioides faecalis]MBS4754130.1 AAA family ATPase [Nocardioides faecalis]